MTLRFDAHHWALILGGSSGIGLATAKKLSAQGMSIAIVHRDRRGAMEAIDREFDAIRRSGTNLVAFNVDGLSPAHRTEVLEDLRARLGSEGKVRLLLHSIAFGNLKLLVEPRKDRTATVARAREALASALEVSGAQLDAALTRVFEQPEGDALLRLIAPSYDESALLDEDDFTRTIHAMGTSLVGWTQQTFAKGLFAGSARVIGLTSEGNELAWRGYAAVAAAKAALESVVRSMAVEFAPHGLRSNIVQPGVTETPALARIPGQRHMKAAARLRNPCGRLTTPEDVADVISLLCTDEAAWVNGALIRVDGGERLGA